MSPSTSVCGQSLSFVVLLSSFTLGVWGQAKPFGISDALHIREMPWRTPISLSQDGEWVAYTVQEEFRTEGSESGTSFYKRSGAEVETDGCDVWVANTKAGETINLTEGKGTSSNPVWSPDGKLLAFYSDRGGTERIWLWERSTRKLRQLSNLMPHTSFGFESVAWTPDSHFILAKVLSEGKTLQLGRSSTQASNHASSGDHSQSALTGVTVYKSVQDSQTQQESGFGALLLGDLVLIDADTGKAERLVSSIDARAFKFSPDGESILITDLQGFERNAQQPIYRLSVYSLPSKKLSVLFPRLHQSYGIAVNWSPDSKSIAYTTSDHGDGYVISAAGGEPLDVTPGQHPWFDERYRGPLWARDGSQLFLTASEADERVATNGIWAAAVDGKAFRRIATIPGHSVEQIVISSSASRPFFSDRSSLVVLATNDETKDQGFWKLDPANGAVSELLEHPRYLGNGAAFLTDSTNDGMTLVYWSQDSRSPQDLWVTDSSFHAPRQITHINPQINNFDLGESRLIHWRSVDGESLQGALLLPAGYQVGVRYPLIVNVYSGERASDVVHRFGFGSDIENQQILATRGYAVLLPDIPVRRDTQTPMLDILKMVMPGVDRAVDLGIADPDRLGVMGYSYGGYSTLSLLVQTTRFRAAVEGAGFADAISMFGDFEGGQDDTGYLERGQGRMGGTPWQLRDKYIENSPVFYLDRVKTPLLIFQGESDAGWKQQDEVFVGLRRLGKEAVYVRYAKEGHADWKPSTEEDYVNRLLQWFGDHLSSRSAATVEKAWRESGSSACK